MSFDGRTNNDALTMLPMAAMLSFRPGPKLLLTALQTWLTSSHSFLWSSLSKSITSCMMRHGSWHGQLVRVLLDACSNSEQCIGMHVLLQRAVSTPDVYLDIISLWDQHQPAWVIRVIHEQDCTEAQPYYFVLALNVYEQNLSIPGQYTD